ncbi:MAG TPA: dihydrolipoamide acetyltransferase family protein [Chloroflexota bacterium]|nr:dihydrolipoamide acetyltransferase family protein [Chloroflexota bacterium]
MATEIVMPRLSDTMEQGTIARWLKKPGDEVKKGEPLAEIETDKATMNLESFTSGRLQKILLPEGQTVPIGTPIAIVGGLNEAPAETPPVTTGAAVAETAAPPTPAFREAAPQPAPEPSANEARGAIRASPIARRLAEEMGVDLNAVTGTGPGGRITREDVEAIAQAQRAVTPPTPVPAPPPSRGPTPAAPAAAPAGPTSAMQRTIARRMVQSKTTVPHFYVSTAIDLTEASRLRGQLNATWQDTHVGFTEMIVRAVGLALRAVPQVNASWIDDHIEQHADINVGVVVSTEGNGLLIPVLHHVDQTDLRTLTKQFREIVQRARENKPRPGDLDGGTFSVSNLGQHPVEEFLAIINPPESGMLAIGQIAKEPVVKDDQIVIAPRVRISLSADHRVYYGVTGAEFLGKLKDYLEHPLSLLT